MNDDLQKNYEYFYNNKNYYLNYRTSILMDEFIELSWNDTLNISSEDFANLLYNEFRKLKPENELKIYKKRKYSFCSLDFSDVTVSISLKISRIHIAVHRNNNTFSGMRHIKFDITKLHKYIDFIMELGNNIDDWEKEFEKINVIVSKEKKIKSLSEISVYHKIENKLSKMNIEYMLKKDDKILLLIKLKHQKAIKFLFKHNDSETEISNKLDLIEKIKNIFNNQQSSSVEKTFNYRNGLGWKSSKTLNK